MTTIVVCSDGGFFRDLADVGTEVVSVKGLCARPEKIEPFVAESETDLVLALHRTQTDVGEVQAAVRRLGFDPLAVGFVFLDSVGDEGELLRTLAAAAARVSGLPGARSEQVKLIPADRSTRRGFLFMGRPIYVGGPSIDDEGCVSGDGCRACVAACPSGALSWGGGAIAVDLAACVACGTCLTTCPTGSVSNPSVPPAAMEAEVITAIGDGGETLAIRYRCRESIVPSEQGWYQVEVPCTGMLSVGWLLAPWALGAPGVDAVPCSAGGCPLNRDERLGMAVGDAGRVLDALGVEFRLGGPIAEGGAAEDAGGWFTQGGTARVIEYLADDDSVSSARLNVADVGSVSIDPASCTACQMCARACPTAALRSILNGGVSIDFDPRACVACAQCLSVCPELDQGAITLTRGFDLTEWRIGRRELRRESMPRCELCGGAVAPTAMLERIGAKLGEEGRDMMALLSRRCTACRGR